MTQPPSSNEESPIQLCSERLAVEIAAPGSVYQGTRFDWHGFITQVTLDGAHTFCVPESYEPGQGTGGIGMCNEFNNDQPVGYAEAKVGEAFPKLGIGLLKRPDLEAYNFFRPHEIDALFPSVVGTGVDWARFVVQPLDCRGYAARLEKTISVNGNQLVIAYTLENVGRLPLLANEYVHNFMAIDQHPVGPDYRLAFPYAVTLDPTMRRFMEPDVLKVEGEAITLQKIPQRAFYCRPLGFAKTSLPQWELRCLPLGVGVREFDDFSPLRVAVWGMSHVISAEVFVEIPLQPGEKKSWTRRFEFFS
jgi:hypothetical protein